MTDKLFTLLLSLDCVEARSARQATTLPRHARISPRARRPSRPQHRPRQGRGAPEPAPVWDGAREVYRIPKKERVWNLRNVSSAAQTQ